LTRYFFAFLNRDLLFFKDVFFGCSSIMISTVFSLVFDTSLPTVSSFQAIVSQLSNFLKLGLFWAFENTTHKMTRHITENTRVPFLVKFIRIFLRRIRILDPHAYHL